MKLYYERRARQYNNDPLVKRTHVVNLRILTQTFVAMFLDAPHESHRHEAKLLERYAGENGTRKLFREDHSPLPYFVCALAWHMFDKYLREGRISKRYWTYKAQLFLIFRHCVGEHPPNLRRSKAIDAYCEKIFQMLKEPEFGRQVRSVLEVFDTASKLWVQQGGSRFGIKDSKEFTDLLLVQSRARFKQSEPPKHKREAKETFEGEILRLISRNGVWFGFIKRGFEHENVYFDSRGYSGEPRDLVPNRKVRFEIAQRPRGPFARNVSLCS